MATSVEYQQKVRREMKRSTIIIEYSNEKNLDEFLSYVRNKLLEGVDKETKTYYINQNSMVTTFSQVYCENYKRDSDIRVDNGVCHEIIKSNV